MHRLTPSTAKLKLVAVLRSPQYLFRLWIALVLPVSLYNAAIAQAADPAWLRYESFKNTPTGTPHLIAIVGPGPVLRSAGQELVRALGTRPASGGRTATLPAKDAFVLGPLKQLRTYFPELKPAQVLSPDGFWLKTVQRKGGKYWVIAGGRDRGVLYGTFALLRKMVQKQEVSTLDEIENPSAPIRWASEWDNLDGSIERGYAGRSIFFAGGKVRADLTRVSEYARLIASIGIDACSINNVNADPKILRADFIPQLARVAEAFRPWGVRLAISVDLSAPQSVGGLGTFDPLDSQVEAWWKKTVDGIYRQIPDFAGFVIKADSEGRSGPSQYGRNAADAANVIARALKPHGGIILYRAFVYNHHLDWTDPKADRARAAFDYFHPLDGKFEANVVLQIKHGPIDFQVREPASPLFGAMKQTSEAIELQVTQEYLGQQRHLVFIPPMWKQTALDFDMHVNGFTPVKDIVSGKVWARNLGGYNAVVNVGLDHYWLGHPLAMANLYGYGRLAWNPNLSSEQIAAEWSRLTFGNDEKVVHTITRMLLPSWRMYENYTGPLGLQTLTDITGPHYGPNIESSENNGWGQWHRADAKGVGMDRTVASGTGFIGQYSPEVQKIYEPLEKCPDDLLLFMHHVPYTFVLHSGKTVIQYLYDAHYTGAEEASTLVKEWKSLQGRIDDARYNQVLKQQQYQAGHAMVWRDAVANYFHKLSGIEDVQARVGHDANRIEAETMQLSGYSPVDVNPWEAASGGKAVACQTGSTCIASFTFHGDAGSYRVAVQYFDQNNGVSNYQLLVDDHIIDSWAADDHLPADKMNGHTSTRHLAVGVELKPGSVVKIVGHPDAGEPAPLDYLEETQIIEGERQ